tara:strand:+ start:4288 stop:5274 length:987 start_codon:yes stop_codon:yes gene_type:complete
MSNQMTIQAILGRKLGTTGMVRQTGDIDCVTAIVAGPCTITQLKTHDNDGYCAVQIGFEEAKNSNKPMSGHLSASGNKFKHLAEVRLPNSDSIDPEYENQLNIGQVIDVNSFSVGDRIDVTGYSKGRGFSGGIKRHGFHGGPKTHGQSDRHRAPGSIGAGSTPGKVIKGMKMAGHYGDEKVTVQNLEVVQTDSNRNLIFVKGAIPGARNSIIYLRRSIKDPKNQGLIIELQEPVVEDEMIEETPVAEAVETPVAEAVETPAAEAEEEPAAEAEETPAAEAEETPVAEAEEEPVAEAEETPVAEAEEEPAAEAEEEPATETEEEQKSQS